MRITVHVMNAPSIRPVLDIKLMLLSTINLMKWKLGNQLGLFRSSASGLADVRPLAAGQARIPRCRGWWPQPAKKKRRPRRRRFSQPRGRRTAPGNTYVFSSNYRAQLAGADVNSARMAATARRPTPVAGTRMCVRR